jgi:hypothetical protein
LQPFSKPSNQPSTMPTINGSSCDIGTFYYYPNNECRVCPAFSISDRKGSLSCTCLGGFKQTGLGIDLYCEECPAGYFSTPG